MPVQVRFGRGLLNSFEPTQPCVVLADPRAVPQAMATRLSAQWNAHLIEWIWQDKGECEISQLSELAPKVWRALSRHSGSALIAFGGGSSLDMAKILRWRIATGTQALSMETVWRAQGQSLQGELIRHRLLCWPSTAGTGSEVSASATLWDRSAAVPVKLAWQPINGFADEAWVDPDLTQSCPATLTRDCGLDALSHALESLWNVRSSVLSRLLAHRAIRLIIDHLPRLLDDLTDMAAREALSEASVLAGMAMSETQTALAHALSYDLTLHEGMSHGSAVAVWLPYVAGLSCTASPAIRAQLQESLQTEQEPADFLTHWLTQFAIVSRTLAQSPTGTATLAKALASARGRNQVFGAVHAT